jgi:glycosyltransferase involved in cell wall biosynthesis
MNVLLVQIADYLNGGGGAIATYRLHTGLREAGVNSRILCANKTLEGPQSVAVPPLSKWEWRLHTITSNLGLNDIHALSTWKIRDMPVYQEADVINFHGFRKHFSYLALPALTRDKPGVFTLQDIWPFTGHCVVTYDCERWKTGCGKCPYPKVLQAMKRDGSAMEWKLKKWAYGRSDLTFVTLCSEVTERAKQSMLGRYPIREIPAGLDTQALQPHDPQLCRSLLGIPRDKKVIMFAALSLNLPWKGGDLLLEALNGLPESLKSESVLLLLGDKGQAIARESGIETLSYGRVYDDRIKALLYSAADVFVSPSRAESFGLVALESLSCGTPAVAFTVGGMRDYIRAGISGYPATPDDSNDLRRGLIELLEDAKGREKMGKLGREMVLAEYTVELQAARYIELYEELLSRR